jgi:hypothetical protein
MKYPTYPEELTEAQHSEFTVDAETDSDHVWQSARRAVEKKMMSVKTAAEAFGLPEEGLRAYVG